MFWNSLARKNKIGDTKESDMEVVVAIHNSMNEGTWAKVLEWEGVVGEGSAKLVRNECLLIMPPALFVPCLWLVLLAIEYLREIVFVPIYNCCA